MKYSLVIVSLITFHIFTGFLILSSPPSLARMQQNALNNIFALIVCVRIGGGGMASCKSALCICASVRRVALEMRYVETRTNLGS